MIINWCFIYKMFIYIIFRYIVIFAVMVKFHILNVNVKLDMIWRAWFKLVLIKEFNVLNSLVLMRMRADNDILSVARVGWMELTLVEVPVLRCHGYLWILNMNFVRLMFNYNYLILSDLRWFAFAVKLPKQPAHKI